MWIPRPLYESLPYAYMAGGAALLLTRQALPVLAGTDDVAYGGYVLADADGRPDVILIATGSEVPLALEARSELLGRGIKARVVSLPSWELFDAQPQAYRDTILPPSVLARQCKAIAKHSTECRGPA